MSAFLFNHPGSFPDREVVPLDASVLAGTSFEDFPHASELAARVVTRLNASGSEGPSHPTFRLLNPEAARYTRDLIAVVGDRGREHTVRIDLEARSGSAFSTVAGSVRQAVWPGVKTIDFSDSPRDRFAEGLPAVLAKLGHQAEAISIKNPPEVVFVAEAQGTPWRVAYHLQTGGIAGKPLGMDAEGLSTRRFLTGLHLARGYPSRWEVRWLWAASVDAMSATMLFWGVSGLFMWWQMKSTRRGGAVVLAASAAVATFVAIGMHRVIAP